MAKNSQISLDFGSPVDQPAPDKQELKLNGVPETFRLAPPSPEKILAEPKIDTVVETEVIEVPDIPFYTPGAGAAEPSPTETNSPAEVKKEKWQDNSKSRRGRKSIKDMVAEAELINIPEDEVLFSKQYYSIGEVSSMFGVNTSLIRFWETEFAIIKPKKNKKGDRFFRPADVKNLHLIYNLLRRKKFTIEGAKDYLKLNKKKAEQAFEIEQSLRKIRSFLLQLKADL